LFLDELTRDESPARAVVVKSIREEQSFTIQKGKGKKKAVEYNTGEGEDENEEEDDLPLTLTELHSRGTANPLTKCSAIPTDNPSGPSATSSSSSSHRRKNSFDLVLSLARANEVESEAEEGLQGLVGKSTTSSVLPGSISEIPRAWRRGDGGRDSSRVEAIEMVDLEGGRRVERKRAKSVVVEEGSCGIM
jgi:hypothetical protein